MQLLTLDLDPYIGILWTNLKECVIFVISYFIVIHIYVLTVPFALYRAIVTKIIQLYDSDVTGIISGLSAIFHRDFDTFESEKSFHTIVSCLRIRGPILNVDQFQKLFLERVIYRRDPKSGSLLYPELQQYLVRYLGYSFLKKDRQFDIRNHVDVHRCENSVVISPSVLTEIWQDLMIKPFKKHRSPWEMILVENYVADEDELNPPDWIILIRLYHGIGDGFCFQHILSSLFETAYRPHFLTKAGRFQNLFLNLKCLALGPYELVTRSLVSAEEFHQLHVPAQELSNEYFIVESPLIWVQSVKQIKQLYFVSFTTVLAEIICGGLRKFLLKTNKPFPGKVTIGIPVPSSGERKGKLGNHFLLAPLDLPVKVQGRKARFGILQKNLEYLRYSTFMKMLDFFVWRVGNLPSSGVRAMTRKSFFSTSYSTIPGPESQRIFGLGGCEMIEANFTHGLAPDSLGVGVSTITFNGNLRLTLFIDRKLVGSREKAVEIVQCFVEEYLEMKEGKNNLA